MNILIPFLQQYGAITGAVTAIALVVVGGIALWIDFRSDRRQQHNFSVENRRLSEVNLEIGHELNLIPDITQRTILEDVIKADMRAYMTFQLPLVNIGDGPVDILAALTSSRQLPGDPTSGIGTRSRDVEWSDYLSFHWNHGKPGALFCGISTTKNMIGAPDHYVRLAAHEHGNLRRVDAVNQPRALLIRPEAEPTALKAKYTSLMYRVFIVARGYPLGEILRQLGGGPPDPLRNVRKELLQFQSLAQPVYFRWTSVQQAILNLNRFVFRLAISAPLPSTPEPTKPDDDQAAHPTQGSDLQHQGNPNSPAKAPDRHAEDTLGFIADPDVWRIFLMHHWEFVDDVDAAPDALPEKYRVTGRPKQDEQKMITDVSQHVRETWYPNLVIPDDWQTSDEGVKTFNDAQEYCRTHLSHLVEAWDRMCETVNACRAYNERKSKLADKRRRDATVARRKAYPDEWYAALLHNHPIFKPNNKERNYPKRWLALQREAYLVSKPFEPGNRFTRLVTFRSFRMSGAKLLRRPLPLFRRDIPHDPRVLEPFVMRTYYYLVDLNHLTTDADDPAPAESQPPLETE